MVTQREIAGHCNKLTKQQKVEENQVCHGLRIYHLCHHHLESSSGQPTLWSLFQVKTTFIATMWLRLEWDQRAMYLPTVPVACAVMSTMYGWEAGTVMVMGLTAVSALKTQEG